MFEIKGKINTAVCYASVVESAAVEQIRRMCNYEITAGSRIRIMPDVHAGKGCTVGTTMTVTDKPATVFQVLKLLEKKSKIFHMKVCGATVNLEICPE